MAARARQPSPGYVAQSAIAPTVRQAIRSNTSNVDFDVRVAIHATLQQAQIRTPPTAAAFPVVIARAAPLTQPTAPRRALARTHRDDDRLALVFELDAVDHGRVLDAEHGCPYRSVAHAVPRSEFRTIDSPEPRRGRRVARSVGQTAPTETTGEPEIVAKTGLTRSSLYRYLPPRPAPTYTTAPTEDHQ